MSDLSDAIAKGKKEAAARKNADTANANAAANKKAGALANELAKGGKKKLLSPECQRKDHKRCQTSRTCACDCHGELTEAV